MRGSTGSTRSRFLGVLFVLALVAAIATGWAAPAGAAPLYWDNAFSAAVGFWDDGTTFNWSATPGGGGVYTDSAWVGGSDAHFRARPGW